MKTFQLNRDQIYVLQKIYAARKRLLIGTLISSPLVLIGLLRADTTERPDFFIAWHVIFYLLVLGVLYYLYYKKVRPIAKDLEGRSGIWIDLIILRKDEFPMVGKYYFFFESAEFPSKEVNALEFSLYTEGEVYHLPCSQHSKLILNNFGNYKLL